MAVYLVTGRGGTGKSTVAEELVRRGYTAFDGDEIPGLAQSEDLKTGKKITVDYGGFVDYTKIGWNWQPDVLKEFLKRKEDPLFLCGSASNQLKYHELFDKVFVLTLDPATHMERLQTRKSNYGKHPAMQRVIITEQAIFAADAEALGAISIDASQPVSKIADDILKHIHGRK